jgi:hypothetical protein
MNGHRKFISNMFFGWTKASSPLHTKKKVSSPVHAQIETLIFKLIEIYLRNIINISEKMNIHLQQIFYKKVAYNR